MSEQKHALVVDDSKSARLVLRRMLEKHGLAVDTVESAGQALDFLTDRRPDVVFMDHMMPGMDGFEAVKAIKNNPATATIPVMMYTSKGGDLYLGQARALGAVGVLPKTVAPAELFDSLRKIGLIQERRSSPRDPSVSPEDDTASERAEDLVQHRLSPAPFIEPGMRAEPQDAETAARDAHMRALLEEQRVEIRKDILLSLDSVARQTGNKIAREIDEKLHAQAPNPESGEAGRPFDFIPLLLIALLFLSLAWNYSLYRDYQSNRAPAAATTGSTAAQDRVANPALAKLENERAAMQAQRGSGWQATAWAMNQLLDYPYDAIALDGSRIDLVKELLTRLRDAGFAGTLVLQTHAGVFCLQGNEETGFRLPAAELPATDCDFVGNPVQAADTPATHQSLGFANFLSSTPLLSDGSIELDIVSLPREEALAPYPDQQSASAADWNRAAFLNNRVLVQLEPR